MNAAFLSELDQYIARKRYRLINAVAVCENDNIVFERYYNKFTPDSRNNLKSVWKSVLSLTLGVCLDLRLIPGLDEPIRRYLPAFDRNEHPFHKLITIRHLLTMSSGIYWNGGVHYHCPMFAQMSVSRDWVGYIADIPVTDMPGAKFTYKEWDVVLLSAVISAAAGAPAFAICDEYLYKPLGIASGEWPRSACGVDYTVQKGEERSDLTARELIAIGRLMLRGGEWRGKQLISNAYIKEAAAPSAAGRGYGLLWWLSDKGFHGRGFGGQELNVYPEQNLVAVVQAAPTPSGKSYGDLCGNIIADASGQ